MREVTRETLIDLPVERLLLAADTFRLLPEPALAFNRLGCLTIANQAGASLFGGKSDDLIGSPVSHFFPPEAEVGLKEAWAETQKSGGWRGELPILTAGNSVRLAEIRMAVIGEMITMTFAPRTRQELVAETTPDAIRWDEVRDTALAAVACLTTPLPTWAGQVVRFAAGATPAIASRIDRGAGQTVLLTGFTPLVQQVLKAFLNRCEYRAVTVENPSEAGEMLGRHTDRVRAVVLGPGATGAGRFGRAVPSVAVGWTCPGAESLPDSVDPAKFVRAVAEAVAADYWHDTADEESIDQPEFINS